MIQQIGRFVFQLFGVHNGRRQGCFHAFFTNLLGYAFYAFTVKSGSIAGVRIGVFTLSQNPLKIANKGVISYVTIEPAAFSAGVASWAIRIGQYQQGIGITVSTDAHQIQRIARCFAFLPQALLGTAKKRDFATFQCCCQRILIHVTLHEYFAGYGILYDSRQQVVHFIPRQLRKCLLCHFHIHTLVG